jgi:chromosome segregation ATPase
MWNGRWKKPEYDEGPSEIERLTEEIALLKGEVKGLRTERNHTARLNELETEINTLEISKSKLIEDNDKKVRETEHAVGLLRKQQEQDHEHAVRMAKLEVGEENLTKEREAFTKELEFRTSQMAGEMDRFEKITEKILDRLPDVNAALSIGGGKAKKD